MRLHSDGFEYCGHLYNTVPGFAAVANLIAPVVTSFHMVPFSGLLFFLALSYCQSSLALSRFVRFNIQQVRQSQGHASLAPG